MPGQHDFEGVETLQLQAAAETGNGGLCGTALICQLGDGHELHLGVLSQNIVCHLPLCGGELIIGGMDSFQDKEERKAVLEAVMEVARGKITIIAHIACNNTADSQELAAHAESLGVDAIASIPPIYFKLPPYAIAKYWNGMSAAAPNTEFIIYNIPSWPVWHCLYLC